MHVEQRDLQATRDPEVLSFTSILFDRAAAEDPPSDPPSSFRDLLLNQAVQAIVEPWPGYDLEAHFFSPLQDEDTVRYRQEVFADLEDAATIDAVRAFAEQMRGMRRRLEVAGRSRYRHERARWQLDAAALYRDAVSELAAALPALPLRSRGLRAFRTHLVAYATAPAFRSFADEVSAVTAGLEDVRYLVTIKGPRVRVSRYEGEPDFGQDVADTFEKFRQGAVKDYRVKITPGQLLDHVEAKILEIVASQHPESFAALDRFSARYERFRDGLVDRFDREIHFYLAYLAYLEPLVAAGLPTCLPTVSRSSKEVDVVGAYDIVLARKLVAEGRDVVRNDVSLHGRERLLVVTGPNQGGKTTFARMVGQLHHLAAIGCPVPATRAYLFLPDRIFAHFEREEDIRTLQGKLADELVRIREILDAATGDSLLVLNESFASTTLEDARFIGIQVIERLRSLDVLGVYVTFVDELASRDPSTVSMVGLVDPDDPAVRTFRVVRKPADGLAFADAIAAKHGLSAAALRRRLGS